MTRATEAAVPLIDKRATVIVVEGVDGSGKSTLGRRIADTLRLGGRSAAWYPNKNLAPVRDTLDAIAREQGLADRFELLGRDEAQFLASVLKWRDMLDLGEDMERPDHILVLDRYFYTHLALAAVSGTRNLDRLRRLYGLLPRPDLVLLLHLPPEEALRRVRERGTDDNSLGFLRRFAAAYRDLEEYRNGEFTVLDAAEDADSVFAAAWHHVVQGPFAATRAPGIEESVG
ncbi:MULTISPECIES: AAA family ATPase [unclassified Streptomyces]|uniref:dTMP kinase n=1 Tax=unclassified Streptomyces TaxID=2593676 RepID=UPI00190BDF85|nr:MULTISPECIES: AAA family ATPase [unclassified Streptomyces]MBK3568490.1 AAA family ATPase [Streptomyces sp. MBT62]MBK6015426.1 AAA family ATPase [Streptomyces sp. MBT53]